MRQNGHGAFPSWYEVRRPRGVGCVAWLWAIGAFSGHGDVVKPIKNCFFGFVVVWVWGVQFFSEFEKPWLVPSKLLASKLEEKLLANSWLRKTVAKPPPLREV